MAICSRSLRRATWQRLVSVSVLATLALSLQPPSPAHAATFVVDRFDDVFSAQACTPAPNDCSLRGAIEKAFGAAGGDAINLPAGTYVLSPGPDTEEWGDLDIQPGDLSIRGAGASTTIIDANGSLTGKGAIYSYGGSGTLSLSRLSITGGAKGAIISNRSLSMTDVVIDGNSTTGSGGGIYQAGGGVLTLISVTVSNNQSVHSGGGIYLFNGSVSVEDSTISGNQVTANGGGGGINIGSSATGFSFSHTTISGNTAFSGGGGVAIEAGSGTFSHVTLASNTAPSSGGGMFVAGTPTVTVSESTFIGNTAGGDGGGAYVGGTASMSMVRCTLSGNASNATGSPGGGGGIFFSNSTRTLTNSTVSGNSAKADGGGLFSYMPGSSATLTAVTIADNTPNSDGTGGGSGGGLYIYNGTVTLAGSIVADNTGAECVRSAGSLVSSGYNLSSDASCELDGPGDLPSTLAGLGPLADNGGPTQTHALLPGSQAIDASSIVICPTIDQRGFPRPVGAECDIGAYEAGWWVLLPVILRQYP